MSKFKRSVKEYFSLVIIPNSHTKPISINVPIKVIHWAFFTIVIITVLTTIGIFFSVKTSLNLTDYEKLKSEKEINNQQLIEYSQEIDRIQKDLKTLATREEQIKKMLGRNSKKKLKNEIVATDKNQQKLLSAINENSEYIDTDKFKKIFSSQTTSIKKELNKKKSAYIEMFNAVKNIKSRFDNTPSIWPVVGPIRSQFGFRTYPREFHRGLDIGGPIGVPIKATASGRVKFAGWFSGYGLTIILDHGHGYQTLYAHLSKINVRKGQSIQKGNRIGALGSTGFTTGPHLHYEVRQFGVAIAPNKFLKLDMLTAENKVW